MTGSGSPSPWSDLDRPPLSARRLRDTLGRDGWTVDVVDRTGSTNADLAAAARAGAPHGAVLVAEEQSHGRGRLDRQWHAPARSALLMSMLVRPTPPAQRWTMLPFVAGLAAVEAVRGVARVEVSLKWPNDLVHAGRKLGGILVERVDAAAVIGIGLNVSVRTDELPVPQATSVALLGGHADRESLVKELVRAFGRRYSQWTEADGASDAVLPAYRSVCDTIGRDVTVELPGGVSVAGNAKAVDELGRLVVSSADGVEHALSVGDVVHVRGTS